ncbi:MAG: hypothetical protein KKI02_06845, partial [Planctomycetes bacterium]|nr:hypothetical protein [Planctomycetota bacterium]
MSRSGASLVGLPVWGDDLIQGCVAVGEPGSRSVEIVCEDDDARITLPVTSQADYTTDNFKKGFGTRLAAIRPHGGDNWLLAIAADWWAMVFNSVTGHGGPLAPEYEGVPYPGRIQELAAGDRDQIGRPLAAGAGRCQLGAEPPRGVALRPLDHVQRRVVLVAE